MCKVCERILGFNFRFVSVFLPGFFICVYALFCLVCMQLIPRYPSQYRNSKLALHYSYVSVGAFIYAGYSHCIIHHKPNMKESLITSRSLQSKEPCLELPLNLSSDPLFSPAHRNFPSLSTKCGKI